ncbi:MAG: ATP-binding cassette domain-containing protein [Pseudomonadota bacterium]
MTAPLEISGLTKRYGPTAVVDGLDLRLAPGRCHGLLGPNGAGKTTTLRLALGLIEADAGTVRLLGEPMPAGGPRARARVGVVPQADNLDPDFSVRENLLAYGRYFGLGARDLDGRIDELLDFAGLAGKADASVPSLSGGMKRRLTLARALINDPDLVILDEPTTGLDPQARHLVWQGLRRLTARGKTLLLTTHFMEEAERLCDTISIVDRGRVIVEGAPRDLIRGHVEPHVVEVFGEGLADWRSRAQNLSRRCELTGETLFCYVDDPGPVLADLAPRDDVRYLHRPANLEDVFLKLTGRDLRD